MRQTHSSHHPLLRSEPTASKPSPSPRADGRLTPRSAPRATARPGTASRLLPVLAFAMIAFAPGAFAAPADQCLFGTAPEVAGDAAQVRAARDAIATACDCAAFDGSPGNTKGAYAKCVSNVLAQRVEASQLRAACVATVRKFEAKSTCGLDPAGQAVPCVRTVTSSGKVRCAIKPASRCTSAGGSTSVACTAHSACIDAADIDGDLRIAAPGDDGTCAPTGTGADEWRNAVLYLAFVDRFLDGDPSNNGAAIPSVQAAANYSGGDWAGIRQKVDEGYFTDLGVNVLWITVPVDGTDLAGLLADGHLHSAYHGTWPVDLAQVETRFGTLSELQGLVSSAHGAGIRVVLDWVMNHMHQASATYMMHPEWFWEDQVSGQSCVCGSPACPVDGPNARRCWSAPYLPDFNYTVPEAVDFSLDSVVGLVQQTGVDGLRLNGVPFVESSWFASLRSRVEADVEPGSGAHFLLLGDTRTTDPAALSAEVGPAGLDGQFDHPLRAQIVRSLLLRSDSMTTLETFLADNDTRYGSALMPTLMGDHEVPRAIHFAQDTPQWSDPWADGAGMAWVNQPTQPSGTSAYQRLANAFTILFTRPGIPTLYYGDEFGLAGAGVPDNRRTMQWSGYSAGQQLLRDHVRSLASIRAAHEALRVGTRESVSSSNDTLVYRMHSAGDEVYVAINRGDTAQAVTGLPSGTLTDLLTNGAITGPSPVLPARSSAILVAP